ncbi:Gag protease polyprotein-like protein [Abeliophyllum distichum]|uniref:Gag protease polyprotein-like protein n=1 Tax=Abeliophyllum distichum TaxID=126358 RepID=A0ABD1PAK5_9LAMI
MTRGGKTRKLQAELPETHNAPDTEDVRKTRVDESVHRTHDKPRQRNAVENDLVVERIAVAVAVASALQMQHNSDKVYSIERAINLGANVFKGVVDPMVAEAWIVKIEKIFDVMGCPDDKRLHVATFLLEEGAHDWWQSIQARYADPSVITWVDFKRAFYDNYYHRSYKDAKQNEILKLVQGSMTVFEYQKKFVELLKYDHNLVVDEINRCRRFEDGLREEIRSPVTAVGWTEFGKLVEAALRVEKSISERQSQRDEMKFGGSSSQIGTETSGDKKLKKNRREFWPSVFNSGSFKSRSRGDQNSGLSHGSIQQSVKSRSHSQGFFQRSFGSRQGKGFSGARFSQCQSCGRFHLGINHDSIFSHKCCNRHCCRLHLASISTNVHEPVRKKMGYYAEAVHILHSKLMEVVFESLGLRTYYLQKDIEQGFQVMTVNCYPVCAEPNLALRLPPHTDYGTITIILQTHNGLEIMDSNKKWHCVPVIPGSLVVQLGDKMEVLSNGRYKTAVHQATLNPVKRNKRLQGRGGEGRGGEGWGGVGWGGIPSLIGLKPGRKISLVSLTEGYGCGLLGR